jgi:hypothetical protein
MRCNKNSSFWMLSNLWRWMKILNFTWKSTFNHYSFWFEFALPFEAFRIWLQVSNGSIFELTILFKLCLFVLYQCSKTKTTASCWRFSFLSILKSSLTVWWMRWMLSKDSTVETLLFGKRAEWLVLPQYDCLMFIISSIHILERSIKTIFPR